MNNRNYSDHHQNCPQHFVSPFPHTSYFWAFCTSLNTSPDHHTINSGATYRHLQVDSGFRIMNELTWRFLPIIGVNLSVLLSQGLYSLKWFPVNHSADSSFLRVSQSLLCYITLFCSLYYALSRDVYALLFKYNLYNACHLLSPLIIV